MDIKHYDFMYRLEYKKPESIYTHITYEGGNDEEEAIANCINNAVEFHNRYNEPKITANDIRIQKVECEGDYNKILRELQNDRS